MVAILEVIYKTTGFVIPPEFVKLEEADLLRFGENYEHWRGNWKRICMTRPPALVCAPWYTCVEWYTPEEMTRWRRQHPRRSLHRGVT